MHILLAHTQAVPVNLYGGTERVMWDLAKALVVLGHQVSLLVPKGSYCDFAQVIEYQAEKDLNSQIPSTVDVVHFQYQPKLPPNLQISKPYLVTEHGNAPVGKELDRNTVFLSQNHALRHGSNQYVYNGLDWSRYKPLNLSLARRRFHFLGKAAWRVKNVHGAIDTALNSGNELDILGGTRLNLKRGFRFTLSRKIHFHGMVDDDYKQTVMQESKGLLFPVRWHEPFGLAVIESLYFGCPVFGTPYGALPEIVTKDVGVLSNSLATLSDALRAHKSYAPEACSALAQDKFNALCMAQAYYEKYLMVLGGNTINPTQPKLLEPPLKLAWNG